MYGEGDAENKFPEVFSDSKALLQMSVARDGCRGVLC